MVDGGRRGNGSLDSPATCASYDLSGAQPAGQERCGDKKPSVNQQGECHADRRYGDPSAHARPPSACPANKEITATIVRMASNVRMENLGSSMVVILAAGIACLQVPLRR